MPFASARIVGARSVEYSIVMSASGRCTSVSSGSSERSAGSGVDSAVDRMEDPEEDAENSPSDCLACSGSARTLGGMRGSWRCSTMMGMSGLA